MKRIRVRFNLSNGKNFMKWKIEYPNGTVVYLEPNDVQLFMSECTLKNHKKTAQKIFEGANKTVCAWVLCDSVSIIPRDKCRFGIAAENQIRYNPRVTPNWVYDGVVVDGCHFKRLVSIGKSLFIDYKQGGYTKGK